MRRAVLGAGMGAITFLLGGCPTEEWLRTCADIPEDKLARVPERLSETGLFSDVATDTIAPDVHLYEPQFELWSDGAAKRRWIHIPAGTRIDNSNHDFWQFPEGTKVWKEFTRDGVRVETRLLQKTGPSTTDWVPVAYIWNGDQSDAVKTPSGAQNASGTSHDVPEAGNCMACHGGVQSVVLGFSAIQLDHDTPDGVMDLQDLVAMDLLTQTPKSARVPGTETERLALGYLHANCSHCHNQSHPAEGRFTGPPMPPLPGQEQQGMCFYPGADFEFLLRVDQLGSVQDTSTYRTAVGRVIEKGKPDESAVIRRMSRGEMPALGVEVVHQEGVELLRTWISSL